MYTILVSSSIILLARLVNNKKHGGHFFVNHAGFFVHVECIKFLSLRCFCKKNPCRIVFLYTCNLQKDKALESTRAK